MELYMSSVFSQFYQIIDDVKPFLEIYTPDNNAIDLSIQKVNERTLSILLYGAYNAGKSTLINVLLGKNAAAIGEIPTTDRVDEFNWEGYKLLDSPGVNAPIEHEKITLDRLQKTDLVVFVIRQDDQDVKDIYDRIFDCITKNKYVFVVLNYNGLDPNLFGEGSVELLVNQINKILLIEAKNHNLENTLTEKISVLPINLNTALKGKLENKDRLLEHSGYNTFITQFSEWVKHYDNERHFVEVIKNYLSETLVSPITDELNKRTSESSFQKELSQEIYRLETQRNILMNNAASELRHIVLSKKKILFSRLSEISSEIQFKQVIDEYIDDIEREFNNWFTQQSEHIQRVISDTKTLKGNDLLPEKNNGNQAVNQALDHLTTTGSDLLKNQKLVQEGIVEALKILRSNKIAFKGIWVKTFEKWAGKAAVIVSVITTIVDIYRAGKKEDERNQQQESYRMQLYQTIETISNDVIQNLIKTIEEIINNIFEGAIQQYKNELIKLNEKATLAEKHLTEMQLISNRLEKISIH